METLNRSTWTLGGINETNYINFSIGDEENLSREVFLSKLKNVPIELTCLPDDPTSVVFLYPKINSKYGPEYLEPVIHYIFGLSNVAAIVTAIENYYNKSIITHLNKELMETLEQIVSNNKGCSLSGTNLDGIGDHAPIFSHLKQLDDGIYKVVFDYGA